MRLNNGLFANQALVPEGTGGFRPTEAEPPMGSARCCRRGLRQLPHGKSSFFIGKKFFGRESRWSRAVMTKSRPVLPLGRRTTGD